MIKILYTCNLCGLLKVQIEVEPREAGQELMDWMEKMTLILCADHERRSPDCHPEKMSEVLIPIDGARYIGGPAIQ